MDACVHPAVRNVELIFDVVSRQSQQSVQSPVKAQSVAAVHKP
jgi:hypothetical protein